MSDFIYKICSRAIWHEAEAKGRFDGAGIDLEDGFIHFSTPAQVAETAWLHFNGVEGLVLIKVRTEGLPLLWETSRGGQSFPHLYEPLALEFVENVTALPCGPAGEHVFPQEIPLRS